MKKILNSLLIISLLMLSSCSKSDGSTWENVKTASRYLQKGFDSLWGKDFESYQVRSDEEFIGPNEEFIPLNEKDINGNFITTDKAIAQPKKSPGSGGIPNLHNFSTPSHLSSLFRNIHFEVDDHVIRDREDLVIISKMANYLKKHPKTYLCIEGHCDKRASAAYNMALGTRRSNHVRVLLIKQGIDFNRIYTISYGKEKPLTVGNTSSDFRLNRRSQFKIYEKK
ncbi:MAG: Outer membrane lipoprotein Omp16 [Candidatus Anoxychlamydiales bacterium]|nr:Outer membrane lipoprotein Omp16 [Candidatus Anoxychlamydiales bacterium]